jgi:hypothetical protein
MKTLGQICRDAFMGPPNQGTTWEAAAQAVRAAVIEECAQVCDELEQEAAENPSGHDDYSCNDYEFAARQIRALKDKP